MELVDRRIECSLLTELLREVRSGYSRVLVVDGDPGVGKSALMDYVARQAPDFRLIRAAGAESELELPYAALHQLCHPVLDRLDRLPVPQRDALRIAFAMSAGPPPDRLMIGLGALSLLCDVAEDQPLICLIDDFQWVDSGSAQVLMFLARRLVAESIGLIMATRVVSPELAKLPQLNLRGLSDADARVLLDMAWTAPIDEHIRDQIVAETRGNPLALLELPRDLTDREMAGGFGFPGALISGRIEESYERRLADMPEQTRRLLLIAAADPTGDPVLLWRAAAQVGLGVDAAAPAVSDQLAEFGIRVRFRHPLARSAAYRSAPLHERQLVHRALAEATDPGTDPDRRAWHRAQAAQGPDEDVAEELERSADRARARGGLAAAAAFLERATLLTLEPARRTQRALAAASAKVQAGAFDGALEMLALAEGAPLTDFDLARVDLTRAQLAFVTGRGSDAPPLLTKAAERLQSIDAALSRATYLDALQAAIFAGRLAVGGGIVDVAYAAKSSPRPSAPTLADLLLDGLMANYTDGYAVGLPILRRAVSVAREEVPVAEQRFLWLAGIAALHVWDDESWDAVSKRHVELGRSAGALAELPLALSSRAVMLTFAGEFTAAEALYQELKTVTEATGDSLATDPAMSLAAHRGNQLEVSASIEATVNDVMRRGEGMWLSVAELAEAIINNGIGNHQAARTAAQRAAEQPDIALSAWSTIELIEAAARSGAIDVAAEAVERLSEMTSASGTDWALGIEARSRALLNDTADAEGLYVEAIERLGRTRIRVELGRTHLLFGEWLSQERRLLDARKQLHIAQDVFDELGMAGFAQRARRALLAAGATAQPSTAAATGPQLTPQEVQVARLAIEGLTNAEIGARLFISAKTVEYHLRKVFSKLGIRSRNQLQGVASQIRA